MSQLEGLLDIVEEADQAIMAVYGQPDIEVQLKEDATPLTSADIESHQILLRGLARLFPETPVVSEEGDQQLNQEVSQSDSFFLIDPLDGTKEFLAKTGHFTICLAKIEDNQPSLGIVSAPALGVTYYGGNDMGSYRIDAHNGKSPEQIYVAEEDTGIVMISRSYQNRETVDFIERNYPEHELEVAGSQLKYTRIAEGLADVSPRVACRLNTWDLAAGHAILEGAGGKVTKVDGSDIDYRSHDLKVPEFIASR